MKTAFLVLALAATSALAQPYSSKPARFIVGFPPGGSADPTTRIMGQALSEQLLEINREDLALWRRLVKEAGIALE